MAAKNMAKNPAITAGARLVEIEKIKSTLFERQEKGDIEELARNIAKTGQLEPILIRELDDGSYQVVAGHRRLEAAKMLGLKEIEAKVIKGDELTALNILLSENIFRKDFNDFEIAQILHKMIQQGLKAVQIAQRLGKSPAWVSTKLRVLEAPKEVQEAVKAGKITAEHARQLSKLKDEKERQKAIEKATKQRLTVKEAKEISEKDKEREELKEQIETLRKELKQAREKLKEYDEAEERLKTIDEEIEDLEKEINKIDAELREVKAKAPNGVEFDLETVSDKIKDIEHDYETKKASVQREEEELRKLEEELKETERVSVKFVEFEEVNGKLVKKEVTKVFNVNEAVKTEYSEIYVDAQSKIEELERQLKILRAKRDNAKAVVDAIERAIRERKRLTKSIKDQKEKLRVAKEDLRDFEKKYADTLMNKETWLKLGEQAKELVNKKISAVKRIAELRNERKSLTSKVNNRDKTEKRISEIEKQIKELEAQLKQLS